MTKVGDTRFVSIGRARTILSRLVEQQGSTVLLLHNEPVAALLSIEKYNDYLAMEKLIRQPALFDRLRSMAAKAHATPIAMLHTMKDLELLHEAQRGIAKDAEKPGTASFR